MIQFAQSTFGASLAPSSSRSWQIIFICGVVKDSRRLADHRTPVEHPKLARFGQTALTIKKHNVFKTEMG